MQVTKRKDIKDISTFTGACEYPDGSKFWYLNGNLHRVDGPACEYSNGTKAWWLFGKPLIQQLILAIESGKF